MSRNKLKIQAESVLTMVFFKGDGQVPVYLFFSVNGSGHFCGMAEMQSRVDYNRKTGVWTQDKWRGCFQVKWIYVKDVPNSLLRNIKLENNDNKPVTNSRDTQEIPYDKGRQVLKVFHTYNHSSSILDDFEHYERKQEEDKSMHPSVNQAEDLIEARPVEQTNDQLQNENQKQLEASNADSSVQNTTTATTLSNISVTTSPSSSSSSSIEQQQQQQQPQLLESTQPQNAELTVSSS